MKKLLTLLLASLFCVAAHAEQKGIKDKTVLFIVTSGKQLKVNDKPVTLGYWGEELSAPWETLKAAGIKVVFASPTGKITLDPASLNPQFASTATIAQVKAADEALSKTIILRLSKMNGKKYDAVLVVGGHGAMFDINRNPDTLRILKQAYKAGKIVAAECHGTGALAFAGLIKDLPVTGFPKVWESPELTPLLPYVLEDELNKASGGNYRSELADGQAPKPLAIVSGRVITSRDPMSSEAMGKALLTELSK